MLTLVPMYTVCMGAIQAHDPTMPNIYGDILFKNSIAVFDRGNVSYIKPRIGFAAKA